MTDAERLEDCGMCGLPYHRYCDHDPEHDWSPTACINALRAEVERLRGVVEAARAESAFEAWWNSDIPTPPMPEIDLYPTSPFTPRRIYFGPNNRGTAWAAWQAALAELEAKP